MSAFTKFLLGVLATALLAWVGYGPMGHGVRMIDDLTARANRALIDTGLIGVTVEMQRQPLRRVALLQGDLTPAEKQRALATVGAVRGVHDVAWSDSGIGSETQR